MYRPLHAISRHPLGLCEEPRRVSTVTVDCVRRRPLPPSLRRPSRCRIAPLDPQADQQARKDRGDEWKPCDCNPREAKAEWQCRDKEAGT